MASMADNTPNVEAQGDHVLTPDEVNAEREKVLANREAELDRRERAFNQSPTAKAEQAANTVDEEAVQARKDQGYYCPGCGRPASYQRECTGTGTAPHPPIEVVSSDELDGDDHTAAPGS